MDLSQVTTVHARSRPGDQAIVDVGEGRTFTWAELDERVRKLACALLDSGMAPGDRLGVLSRNTHRILELYLAAAKAGLVLVPLNTRLVPRELAFQISDSAMSAMVVDAPFEESAREAGADEAVKLVLGMGEGHGASFDYETFLSAGRSVADPVKVDGSLPFTLGYTSGTTGTPKGALITQHSHALASLLAGSAWGNSPRHRNMVCLPLFLAGGWNGAAAYGLTLGATSYVMDFDPAKVIEVTAREGINHLPLVPTMVGLILGVPGVEDLDLSALRTVLYAGSPMPAKLLPRAIEVFGERFVSPYGMTESGCIGTVLLPSDIHLGADGQAAPRASSAGRSMPMMEVRIVDDGEEVPADGVTPGEIQLRGETLLREYWGRPEATAEAFVDGWFRTGDVGVRDEDGYIWIVDRTKDMIISGGSNVASVEVESALYGHPGIQLVAVVGVPDERWGEAVTAFVQPKPGVEIAESELRELAKQSLADYKRPKSYRFVDSMPMTALGKISKKDLRAPFWEGRQRAV